MHYLRKLLLVGFAALMLCAALASSAFAVTAYDQGTGANLGVGAGVSGANSGTTLSGTFFGLSNATITCASSTVAGSVTANPSASNNVLGNITSLSFSSCNSTQTGTACKPVATVSSANPMKLLANSTTQVNLGTPSGTYVDITTCVNGGTCHVGGGNASGTFGSDSLTNYLTGSWTNSSASLGLSSASVKNVDSTVCLSNGGWTGSYHLTVAATGNNAGLH